MQQPRVIIGLLLSALVLAGLACGERTPISGVVSEATPTPPPTAEAEREEPTPTAAVEGPIHTRFLLGGWVAPKDEDADDRPFADTLKAFVITTDEGLREFLDSLDLLRVRGSQESLNRADLSDVVVVAMYYLWRPLKGDPLSLEEARLSGNEVRIRLELVGGPPGAGVAFSAGAPVHCGPRQGGLTPGSATQLRVPAEWKGIGNSNSHPGMKAR